MFDRASVFGAVAQPASYTTPTPVGSQLLVTPALLQGPRYSTMPMTVARGAFLPGEGVPPRGGVPIVVPGQRGPAPPPMERPVGPGGEIIVDGAPPPQLGPALQAGVEEAGKSIRTVVIVVGALGIAGLALYFFTRKTAKKNPEEATANRYRGHPSDRGKPWTKARAHRASAYRRRRKKTRRVRVN